MTISIKPTASGSTIEQDGSTVLSIESDRSVDIDSGTLHVDATNNNVGIGTTTISTGYSGGNGSLTLQNAKSIAFNNSSNTWSVSTTGGAITYFTDNNLYIDAKDSASNMIFRVNNATERMRIDSSGNVLIGTTIDLVAGGEGVKIRSDLGVIFTARNTTVTASHNIFYNSNGQVGSITTAGSNTSYNTSSDYRLKENVAPMSGSIDRLKQLKPSTWAWIQDGSHGEGFLAHEAQEIVPECATGTKDAMRTEEYEVTPAVLGDYGRVVTEAVMGTREVPDYQGIDQAKLVPLLTAALQEAITKIEDLETRIQALESN